MSASSPRLDIVTHPTYRPEIDGLRAIAVIGVVVFHVGAYRTGGFAGVDVFFVISGYLITSLLLAEQATTGRIALPAFYARRVRRLLPALLVVVLATVGAAAFLLSAQLHEVQDVVKSAAASLTFVSNVLFYRTTGDYFSGPAEFIPLLHIWSLSVEEQFYLLWPVTLALLLRRRPGAIRLAVASAIAMSWLAALAMVMFQPQAAFYLTPFRAWEFGVGAFVSIRRPRNLAPRTRELLATTGALAIVAALLLTPSGRWFPAVGGLAPVLGTGLVLAALADGEADFFVARLLRLRPMVAVGRASYSWYLWHWPALALYGALSIDGGSRAARAAIGVFTLGLAALTLRFVEDPIRRGRRGTSWAARQTLTIGVASSAAALAMCAAVFMWARSVAASPSEVHTLLAEQSLGTDACSVSPGARALPPLDSVCVKGSTSGPVMILWGDSHAQHWLPFAESVAESRGVGLVQLTMPACAPVPRGYAARSYDPKNPRWQQRCVENNERVLRLAREGTFLGRPITAVIIAVKWSDRLRRPFSSLGRVKYDQRTPPSLEARRASVVSGIPAAIASLPQPIEVLVMGPLPELRAAMPTCIVRRLEGQCAMPRIIYDSLRSEVFAIIDSVRSRRPNTAIVDPTNYFCDQTQCAVRRNQLVLFDDDEHISRRAARGFAAWWLPPHGNRALSAQAMARD